MAAAWRSSPVLLCVIAIALAAGAAATLVASATQPYHGAGPALAPTVVSPTLLGIAFLAPLVVGFSVLIYRRVKYGGLKLPTPVVAAAVAVLLVLVAFAVLGHFLNPGGPLGSKPTSTSSPPTNQTNTSKTGTSNGSGSGGGPLALPTIHRLPDWLLYVVGVVVALAVIGVVLPAAWAGSLRRRGTVPAYDEPAARRGAQAALAKAASDLDAGADPRRVIEALYVELLERVSVVAGDLSGRTPEEIRAEQLLPLGVRPPEAAALTRLFEEARYSSHPLGPEAAARVRQAVAAASEDLARAPTRAP